MFREVLSPTPCLLGLFGDASHDFHIEKLEIKFQHTGWEDLIEFAAGTPAVWQQAYWLYASKSWVGLPQLLSTLPDLTELEIGESEEPSSANFLPYLASQPIARQLTRLRLSDMNLGKNGSH